MTSQPSGSGGRTHRTGDPNRLQVQPLQLHNRNNTRPQRPSASSGSGVVSQTSQSTGNTRDSSAPTSHPTPRSGHSGTPRQVPRAPKSELTRSFDPNSDMHLWTMWRTAVTGRIMDGVRQNYHSAGAVGRTAPGGRDGETYAYGPGLVKTPLGRFVCVKNGSNTLANLMEDPHGEVGSELQMEQFVFFGLPRVDLNNSRRSTHLPGDHHPNNHPNNHHHHHHNHQ